MKNHTYKLTVQWTGNIGTGTSTYKNFERSHNILIDGKPNIEASSDPSFLGDNTKHNPEELFLASLASCHMLWYLHLCAVAGVIIVAYEDNATGTMVENPNGSGHFTEVTLYPMVTVANKSMIEKATVLHQKTNTYCFIANSVNFTVKHKPTIKAIESTPT